MILETSTRTVNSSLSDSREFGFSAGAKAFSILSDLYSDRILAILRELGTNAADAHAAVGKKDRPFFVHLPTQFESYFSIRDYGPGLSYDEVFNVYTVYFDSSKTESNLFTGALGLGSKSPFSYTDTFTVRSIQNGFASEYLAFLSDEEIPSFSCVTRDTPTAEEDGLQVQFAVPSEDIHAFSDRAERVYSAFEVCPQFNIDLSFPMLFDTLCSDGGIVVELSDGVTGYISPGSGFSIDVLEGNILYPTGVRPQEISWRGFDKHLQDWILNFYTRGTRIVLHTPIGTVEPAPSRDALKLTKRTKTLLIDFLSELKALYSEQILLSAVSADNVLDALTIFNEHVVAPTDDARVAFLTELYDTFPELASVCNLADVDFRLSPRDRDVLWRFPVDEDAPVVELRADFTRKGASYFVTHTHTDLTPDDLRLLREHRVILVDDSYDYKKALYRIKRHINHPEGELESRVDYMVVRNPAILKLAGVSDVAVVYDESINSTAQLRSERTKGKGRAGEAKNFTVLYNGLDPDFEVGEAVGNSVVRGFVDEYGGDVVFLLPALSGAMSHALRFTREHHLILPFIVVQYDEQAESGLKRFRRLVEALPPSSFDNEPALFEQLLEYRGAFQNVDGAHLLSGVYRGEGGDSAFWQEKSILTAVRVFADKYGRERLPEGVLRDFVDAFQFPPVPQDFNRIVFAVRENSYLTNIFQPTGGVIDMRYSAVRGAFLHRYPMAGELLVDYDWVDRICYSGERGEKPEAMLKEVLLYMKAVEKRERASGGS